MTTVAALDHVRAVADAVLYEGYLLYPYRASSAKNQSRWQFGVLGPPRASAASFAEDPAMSMQCLLAGGADSSGEPRVTVHLRFLQLQERSVERLDGGHHVPVSQLVVGERTLLSWEEATEHEIPLPAYSVTQAFAGVAQPEVRTGIDVPGGVDVEPVVDDAGVPVGRIVRRRYPLRAVVDVGARPDDGLVRLTVAVANAHPDEVHGKEEAIRFSLIGTHHLVMADGATMVSLLEPPVESAAAAARCRQSRCYPVLVGPAGATDVVLGSPIILYDHPEIAEQSAGALFDSTEIDEILTLRVMTMTEAEKTEARETDERAAAIIDRCDQMSPAALQQLHGVLRDPHGASSPVTPTPESSDTGEVPWWDPAGGDDQVRPESDSVVVDGTTVSRGSLVRIHPSRRADAQDLFYAGQVARVTAVLSDVDGSTHVALVLVDDPAADLHDWYGRYLYFAPDELAPLEQAREESSP